MCCSRIEMAGLDRSCQAPGPRVTGDALDRCTDCGPHCPEKHGHGPSFSSEPGKRAMTRLRSRSPWIPGGRVWTQPRRLEHLCPHSHSINTLCFSPPGATVTNERQVDGLK